VKIKTKRYHIYYWMQILFFFIRFIPLRCSLAVASVLGRIVFYLVRKHRDIAINNLNSVFVDGKHDAAVIAKRLFINLAKNGAEWVKLINSNNVDYGRLVTEEYGLDRLDEALSGGRGAIVLTGHFGNWELLMSYVKSKGYRGAVIGKRLYFHKYNDFINRLRLKTGDRVIYRDESPKKFLKVLRDGEIIGMLADQDISSVPGIFVEFFGKPAYTPVAPVKLSMASGAPIVPAFIIRKSDNTHKVIFEKPIAVKKGDSVDESTVEYTMAWTKVLEKYIRDYPEQWVWIHERWKTKN